MAEFIILGDGDDTLFRSTFYDGSGISSYNGGLGNDTLDFSSSTVGYIWYEWPFNWVQDPNIPAGFVEEIGREVFVFAFIQSFETVIAGSGDDIFYVSDATMTLDGGSGNDVFLWSVSNSFDDGDHFVGNAGDDIIDFSDRPFTGYGFVFDHLRGTITSRGTGEVATFSGFEAVIATSDNDIIVPGLGAVLYDAGEGENIFDLDNGSFSSGSTYLGGNSIDTLRFSTFVDGITVDLAAGGMTFESPLVTVFAFVQQIDVIEAGSGNDTLTGAQGPQTIAGGAGDDMIRGLGGRDALYGQDGNDTILGGNGRDTIEGGDDNDVVRGGRGRDDIDGGDGNDVLQGGRGRDTVAGGEGNDRVNGGSGDDDLNGQAGNDRILGGRGDDRIAGGDGEDTIVGGGGDDILSGGDDGDRFVFRPAHGNDVVLDFDVTEGDVADVSRIGRLRDFEDVLDRATETAQGVEIATGPNSSFILEGLTLADLDADVFLI